MGSRQLVILSNEPPPSGGGMAALGSRREIVERLSTLNVSPDHDGGDFLYGPGFVIELPPDGAPITQMLLSINEDEIAWHVIMRMVRELDWKMLDPTTGQELGG